ncbi:MAG: hypothetical protein ACXU8N_16755 [Telluria sp.]
MSAIRLAACVAGALLACGCAMQGLPQRSEVSVEASLESADAALRGGQPDRAAEILTAAAAAHPADKAPLLRIAQLRYDRAEYGAAIVSAQAALQREPDNVLAHSIVAVSGLRVASKALADLSSRNNLNGTVRGEAEDLARMLRTSLGEDALVNGHPRPQAAQLQHQPPRRAEAAHASHPSPNDPFGALK